MWRGNAEPRGSAKWNLYFGLIIDSHWLAYSPLAFTHSSHLSLLFLFLQSEPTSVSDSECACNFQAFVRLIALPTWPPNCPLVTTLRATTKNYYRHSEGVQKLAIQNKFISKYSTAYWAYSAKNGRYSNAYCIGENAIHLRLTVLTFNRNQQTLNKFLLEKDKSWRESTESCYCGRSSGRASISNKPRVR